jgi:hypothetical protein
MKKTYTTLLFLFLISYSGLFSQGWEKIYSGIYSHGFSSYGPSIQQAQPTSDGGNIFVGYTNNNSFYQINIVKTNESGDITWSKSISDSIDLISESVLEISDGFLIGGQSYTLASSILIKIDFAGNVIWSKKYGGGQGISLIKETGSGFLLLGKKGYSGIFVSKINSSGTLIWNKTISVSELYLKGIAPAEDDGFVMIAQKQSYTYGLGDECWVMKFDSTGNILWSNKYGYSNSFIPNCIRRLSNGDYIIGGIILMKINSAGKLIWVKEWNQGGTLIQDLYPTADNRFVIAAGGYYASGIFLYKVSSEGIPEWKKVFGNSNDYPTKISVTSDQKFLIYGYRQDVIAQNSGFYIIKTNTTGETGCNTDIGTLPSYVPRSCICVVKSVTVHATSANTNLESDFTFASADFATPVINSCCNAKAKIINENYHPCRGDSISFTGCGAPHLQWYNGDTTRSITTSDTLVYLTVTNTCGSFADTLIIHPAFNPWVGYTINKDTICRGDSVLLNITGNAPYYYCYGLFTHPLNSTTYILKPTETSIYTVVGYTSTHGPDCQSRQSFTVYVNPDKPKITKVGDTLFSSSSINNQWFLNGNIISGATNRFLIVDQAGSYSVRVSMSGCNNESDAFTCNTDDAVYGRNAWQKLIGTEGYAMGACILQTNDNGFIIGGSRNNSLLTNDDVTLIKTDVNGEVVWSKVYGGVGIDRIYDLIKVDNGYAAVGFTTSFGNGNTDVYLLRFDENGELLWSKTYGDWNNQAAGSIELTSDGNFIITGYSTNPNSYSVDSDGRLINENDLYLLKTDHNGNLLWSKVFNSDNNEYGAEVHETSDGNYIVAGCSEDSHRKDRVYLLKTDPDGNVLWSKTIANTFFAATASMKITPDNGFLVCTGASGSAYLLKLDNTGNVVWSKIAHVNTWGNSLTITKDHAAVFTGGFGLGIGALTKINMDGELIWSTAFPNNPQQYVSKVLQLNDSSYIMTGIVDTTNHYGPGQINLINTDVDGQTNCSQFNYPVITDEPYSYCAHTTVAASLGNEMSAMTTSYPATFASTTLCRTAGFLSSITEKKEGLTLKVYPNPSTGIINLEFSETKLIAAISVFDIAGRCVFNQQINSNYFYQINLNNKSKGIYFLEIKTTHGKEVRKIILN